MGRQRRRGSGVKWLNHYSSAQSILVVGDGDMSFSLALAAAFGSGENLVATSLDSYDTLTSKYGKAESNVTELERLGATVFHGVYAKMMKRHPCLKMRRFDRIVFNFPHAGFIAQEQQDHMIKAHQLLVRRFFRNASHLLHPDSEIHVSHRTGQPYDRWQIEELASEFSLVISEIVTFRKEAYPGYNQKRGDGEWCDEEFPLRNGCTYKFRVERGEAEKPRSRKFTTAWSESLHRQQESLDAVTKLHQEKQQQLLQLQKELISILDSPSGDWRRSPSGDKFYRHVKPIEPKVSPPEKILHATAKGEMEPRHPVSSRLIYPGESRLDQGVNRPKKHSLFRSAQKAWRAKSLGTVTTEAGKSVQVINTDSIIIVTQVLNIREPIVSKNQGKSKGSILTIVPKPSVNDHKASTSQAKPSDPKYTQPKWCPSGLTKTQKRKLQRLKNQEKVEKEAERQIDESFNKDHPMIPSLVWMPKKTDLVAPVAAVPSPVVTVEEESGITPLVPAKISWADEAEAADLQEQESAKLSEQMSESTGEESADLSEHMSESAYALEEESVDFDITPTRTGMDMNMVYYLPTEFCAVDEDREVG